MYTVLYCQFSNTMHTMVTLSICVVTMSKDKILFLVVPKSLLSPDFGKYRFDGSYCPGNLQKSIFSRCLFLTSSLCLCLYSNCFGLYSPFILIAHLQRVAILDWNSILTWKGNKNCMRLFVKDGLYCARVVFEYTCKNMVPWSLNLGLISNDLNSIQWSPSST